jgi:FkbM family methyltransferase
MQESLRNASASVLRRLPLRGRWRLIHLIAGEPREPTPVIARVPRVGIMELDLSSGLEREIFVTGTHGDEHVIAARLREQLDGEGAVFVDVGANVGYHTVGLGRHLARKGGSVFAFEPIAANHDRLLGNVARNKLDNVHVEKAGLWDRDTTMEVGRSTRGSSNVSLASTGEITETVRLLRFDDWVRDRGLDRVDVVKMDIEGAEVRALKGMRAAVGRFRPVLFVEINPMWTRRMGTSTTELTGLLHELGYALYDCRRSGGGEPVTHVDPGGTAEMNVIGLPR